MKQLGWWLAVALLLVASAASAALLLRGSGGAPPAATIVDILPHTTSIQTSLASGAYVTTFSCVMNDNSACPPAGSGYVWSIANAPSFVTVDANTGMLSTNRALTGADACTPAQDNCTFSVTIGPPTTPPPGPPNIATIVVTPAAITAGGVFNGTLKTICSPTACPNSPIYSFSTSCGGSNNGLFTLNGATLASNGALAQQDYYVCIAANMSGVTNSGSTGSGYIAVTGTSGTPSTITGVKFFSTGTSSVSFVSPPGTLADNLAPVCSTGQCINGDQNWTLDTTPGACAQPLSPAFSPMNGAPGLNITTANAVPPGTYYACVSVVIRGTSNSGGSFLATATANPVQYSLASVWVSPNQIVSATPAPFSGTLSTRCSTQLQSDVACPSGTTSYALVANSNCTAIENYNPPYVFSGSVSGTTMTSSGNLSTGIPAPTYFACVQVTSTNVTNSGANFMVPVFGLSSAPTLTVNASTTGTTVASADAFTAAWGSASGDRWLVMRVCGGTGNLYPPDCDAKQHVITYDTCLAFPPTYIANYQGSCPHYVSPTAGGNYRLSLYDGNLNVNGGYGNVLATAPFTVSAPIPPSGSNHGGYVIGVEYTDTTWYQYIGRDPMLQGCGNICYPPNATAQHFALPIMTSQGDAAAAAASPTYFANYLQSRNIDAVAPWIYWMRLCNEWVGNPQCGPFVNADPNQGEAIAPATWIAAVCNAATAIRQDHNLDNMKIALDVPYSAEQAKYYPAACANQIDILTNDMYPGMGQGGTSVDAWNWLTGTNCTGPPSGTADCGPLAWILYYNKPAAFPEWCSKFGDGYLWKKMFEWMNTHNAVGWVFWEDDTHGAGAPGEFNCNYNDTLDRSDEVHNMVWQYQYTGSYWPSVIPWTGFK